MAAGKANRFLTLSYLEDEEQRGERRSQDIFLRILIVGYIKSEYAHTKKFLPQHVQLVHIETSFGDRRKLPAQHL